MLSIVSAMPIIKIQWPLFPLETLDFCMSEKSTTPVWISDAFDAVSFDLIVSQSLLDKVFSSTLSLDVSNNAAVVDGVLAGGV